MIKIKAITEVKQKRKEREIKVRKSYIESASEETHATICRIRMYIEGNRVSIVSIIREEDEDQLRSSFGYPLPQ